MLRFSCLCKIFHIFTDIFMRLLYVIHWILIYPHDFWKSQIQYFSDDRFLPQPNIANMSQTNFPMMKQPYDTNDSRSIEIASCEFYIKDNAKAHHTENYDLLEEKDPSPILRRGQPFQMAIRFSRPFNMDSNSITVELTLGKVSK